MPVPAVLVAGTEWLSLVCRSAHPAPVGDRRHGACRVHSRLGSPLRAPPTGSRSPAVSPHAPSFPMAVTAGVLGSCWLCQWERGGSLQTRNHQWFSMEVVSSAGRRNQAQQPSGEDTVLVTWLTLLWGWGGGSRELWGPPASQVSPCSCHTYLKADGGMVALAAGERGEAWGFLCRAVCTAVPRPLWTSQVGGQCTALGVLCTVSPLTRPSGGLSSCFWGVRLPANLGPWPWDPAGTSSCFYL